MVLSQDIKNCLNKSVLCWLATSSAEGQPNVSPKEIFTHIDNEFIIIANIASPNTIKNIRSNLKVCLSILDILAQKGYQLKGSAEIIEKKTNSFEKYWKPLYAMAGDKFPFNSIIKIQVESAKEILAPSYILYPESTTVESQIENAKRAYRLGE